MPAILVPETFRPSILALIAGEPVGLTGPTLLLIASVALRSLALIAIAGLLILMVLPAVLAMAAEASSA